MSSAAPSFFGFLHRKIRSPTSTRTHFPTISFGKAMKPLKRYLRILAAGLLLSATQACKNTAAGSGNMKLSGNSLQAELSPEKAIEVTRRYCKKTKIDLSRYHEPKAKPIERKGRLFWLVFYELNVAPDQVILSGTGILGFTVNDATREVSVHPQY